MALYDNKYWLLSHIRNSFISTDDTGMCELVMVGIHLPKNLVDELNCYPDSDESQDDEDEMGHESYDIPLDTDIGRTRVNTSGRLERFDVRKRTVRTKTIKWENTGRRITQEEHDKLFVKKDTSTKSNVSKSFKSLLADNLKKSSETPQNALMEYARFDGSTQVGIPLRKYKIFLTMLSEEQRNYPMPIICVATAKIQDLIGLILLKSSAVHGGFLPQPVVCYGLYITEEDGEVDHDLPCLDPKECVAKFGFTCLGLVEHKNMKNVSFEQSKMISLFSENIEENNLEKKKSSSSAEENRQLSADMQLMAVHTKAMEAPLYQSFRVNLINKLMSNVEINLGVSGEKIEIDPVQQKTSKFVLGRQKAVSHHIDAVASCHLLENKSSKATFRIICSLSFGNKDRMETLQSSATLKTYEFEGEGTVVEEIVQKINLILQIRSSVVRKEYLAYKEQKSKSRKSFG